ncbi:MAG: NeuD/PglB/VioB family sugar acetyltransferase [Propioniciclava sp.]|uniref:NeuD/PglB/VioB family sugar acetyltransferase n=1 Tax=Propioniciclava sp. TaxID=2038686 RepID=UPI0039E57375
MAALIVGASGLAREVLPLLRERAIEPIGVLDDRHAQLGGTYAGLPLLGGIDDVVAHAGTDLVLCVGSSPGRAAVRARLEALGVEESRYLTVVDPSVRNPAGCPIGAGSILFAGVVLTADVSMGASVVAMPNVIFTHDCVIDEGATFAGGVSLGGSVHVGQNAYLGMNATVLPGRAIGRGAVVGMGAVVLSDVPDGETWAGVPARSLGGQS